MAKRLSLDQKFVEKLGNIIEVNILNNQFGVSELAAEVGLSRSQLHRKLKSINGKSSSQFIREYRLEKAMAMLKENSGTVSEISFQVGFTSPSYFSSRFNEYYGFPPAETKFKNTEVSEERIKKKQNTIVWTLPILFIATFVTVYFYSSKPEIDFTKIEKSIAVLPFINDSSNEENQYFCNGIMVGIRDQLAKIPDFTLVSRLSVEKYRDSAIALQKIAEELGVSYLVEGRVQRIGDRAIISAELVYARGNDLLWSAQYDESITEIFDVQANVIESISMELKTILAPDLLTKISEIPTNDPLAYDHYLKGEEYRFKSGRPDLKQEVWLELLEKAKLSYELALERDSLFSMAYLGLAQTTYARYIPNILEKNKLKEVLELANKVIQIDSNNATAYIIRGNYFRSLNQLDKASKDYEKTFELDPNNPTALLHKSVIHRRNNEFREAIVALKKMEKSAETDLDFVGVYVEYAHYYSLLREHDMEEYYLNRISLIDTTFFNPRLGVYLRNRSFEEALAYTLKKIPGETQQRNAALALTYEQMGNYKKAIEYYKKWNDQVNAQGINSFWGLSAYNGYGVCLIKEGEIEKGKNMLEKQNEFSNKLLKAGRRSYTPSIYYQYAILYATLGDYEKAYEYLKKFENTEEGWSLWGDFVSMTKADTRIEILRDDPIYIASLSRGEEKIKAIQDEIAPLLSKDIID